MENPNFKVLKPVNWGLNQPGPDVLRLAERHVGTVMDREDVTMEVAEAMQDAGYVEIIAGKEDAGKKTEETLTGVRAVIAEVIKDIPGKREAKDALEVWGKENLDGYDLDKSKSLEDCIEDLVAVHDTLKGE